MWGTTFSDLAKKAQELQEQASEAAGSLTSTPVSFFNLDSIRSEDEAESNRPRVPDHERPIEAAGTSKPNSSLNFVDVSVMQTPRRTPPRAPSGKLRVPDSKTFSQETQQQQSPMPLPPQPPQATHISRNSSRVESEEGDGWAEDADLDLAADESTAQHSGGEDKVQLPESSNEIVEKPTASETSEMSPESVIETAPQVLTDNVIMVAESVATEAAHLEPSTEKVDDDEVVDTTTADAFSKNDVPSTVIEQAELNGDSHENTDVPTEMHGTADKEHVRIESFVDVEESSTNDNADSSVEEDTTNNSTENHDLNNQDGGSFNRKLLVLISTQSMNRQTAVRQQKCFTILKAKGIKYETLDGADPVHKEWREELFAVSGIHGHYPQFFFIDLTNGQTNFWGEYEKFEYANDDGVLEEQLSSYGAPVIEWSAPAATHTMQPGSPTSPHNDQSETSESTLGVPEELLEQFSMQMKRVEENHQAELEEMERRHAQELRQALELAKHDLCDQKMREVEQKLHAQIEERENELNEAWRKNEGYKLKLDALEREVAGMQSLIAARDNNLGKLSESHLRELRSMEKKLVEAEDRESKTKQEVVRLEAFVETLQKDLASSKDEHSELRTRLKSLAGELKERRVECRQLHAKLEEEVSTKEGLASDLEHLRLEISHQNRSGSEKDEELEHLRSKVLAAENQVGKMEKEMKEREAKAERTLLEYKRKAQNSLSLANSRTAAAVQAKEEAELEARAARSTADVAMERAVKAEISSKEAVANAKAMVEAMKLEKDNALVELGVVQERLKKFELEKDELASERQHLVSSNEKLTREADRLRREHEVEKETNSKLSKELDATRSKVSALRSSVVVLQEQVRKAEKASAESRTKEKQTEAPIIPPLSPHSADATVIALQRELQEANAVIDELREALKNAIVTQGNRAVGQIPNYEPRQAADENGGGSPLFYAMEKQAELQTARREINRLANLLSDVQLEKTEAVEAMSEMRKRLEESEARLTRFEKLNQTTIGNGHSTQGKSTMANNGAMNIEYLKNIMLSFLNAKTLAERKALVPVIGAVLCLTPDEQRKALQSVEESASLGGVGSSFFESISGRLMQK